jgi:hypothetical protein
MATREEEEQWAAARYRLAHAMEDPHRLGDVDVPGGLRRALARRPLPYAGAALGAILGTAALAGRRRAMRARRRPVIVGSAAAFGLSLLALWGLRQAHREGRSAGI